MKKKIGHERINGSGIEFLNYEGELYAIIIRDNYENDSLIFLTPDNFSQQLGYLPHRKGATIRPHRHKLNIRSVKYTQEVLIIKEGKVKINFYNDENECIHSEILCKADVILLCGGGHGFEMIEDSVMIEVKQGPYTGDEYDKERFLGIE